MAWHDVWPWLSLVANGVLAMLLFFKSALNDIAVKIFLGRRERRDREKQLLREFHAQLQSFEANYFLGIAGVFATMTAGPEGRDSGLKMQNVGLQNIAPTIEFMNRHEFELPASVRSLIPELRAAITIRDLKSLGHGNAEALMAQSEGVREVVQKVEREIQKLLTD